MFQQSYSLYTFQGKLTYEWLASGCLVSYCLGETSNKNVIYTLKNKGSLMTSLVPCRTFNIHRELMLHNMLFIRDAPKWKLLAEAEQHETLGRRPKA